MTLANASGEIMVAGHQTEQLGGQEVVLSKSTSQYRKLL